jgi:hypothetical protein
MGEGNIVIRSGSIVDPFYRIKKREKLKRGSVLMKAIRNIRLSRNDIKEFYAASFSI